MIARMLHTHVTNDTQLRESYDLEMFWKLNPDPKPFGIRDQWVSYSRTLSDPGQLSRAFKANLYN